jgi:hypothetical protein
MKFKTNRSMSSIVDFQTKVRQYNENAFDVVEYEILPLHTEAYSTSDTKNYNFEDIEKIINLNQTKIDDLNREIERLTNNATNVDYFVAIGSGVLTGIIDSLWVGEFDFEALKADSHKHVNKFIEKYAKIRGYKDNGKGLKGAIEFLEKKFPVDQDNIWKATGISSTKLHHLEDLAHHPTVLGLVASIIVQFFRMSIFVDKDGKVNVEMIETSKSDFAKTWLPIIITGILKWTVYLAESKKTINDKEIPKPICILMKRLSAAPAVLEILKVADNWFGHLVSDMGGSKNTPGGGMGIPGIFLSLLKEISSLPGINKTCLPQLVSDWYSKDKIDLRAELAIVEYLGKQSVPVIINECFVRTFYFICRLIEEKSHCQSWQDVNWKNVVPWGNRTITRMITISSGTFMALDLADAAVRSAINNGTPQNPKFWADFVLRINIVGLGRFSIAIVDDVRMGVKRNRLRNERIAIVNEQIFLSAAHFYYKEGEIWEEAESASVAVDELYKRAQYVSVLSYELINDSLKSCSQFSAYLPKVEEKNPELLVRINNILKN